MNEQPIDGGHEAIVRHAPHIDIPEGVRQAAAGTIYQAREKIEELCSNAEAMTDAVELSYSMAVTDAANLQGKMVQAIQADLAANFEFATALLAVRSLPEIIAVSTKFAHQQMDASARQIKDFLSFGQKMMADTTKPITSGFSISLDRAASS